VYIRPARLTTRWVISARGVQYFGNLHAPWMSISVQAQLAIEVAWSACHNTEAVSPEPLQKQPNSSKTPPGGKNEASRVTKVKRPGDECWLDGGKATQS
jgi:hypothetical protein